MKDIRVAKRYAAALFEVARRDGILDAVTQDLALVERFLEGVPYLRAVLLQPLVTEERKYQVAGDAFGDRVTATTLSFVRLLIRKRREELIGACIQEFRTLLAEHNNTIDAVATTAVPMTDAQAARLTDSLQKLTGKTVTLTTQTDPTIIGGAVVRLGDTVIDGSVSGGLERLEQRLLGTRSMGGVS
jgi:F-type H+-transporting ATPase subunit delta